MNPFDIVLLCQDIKREGQLDLNVLCRDALRTGGSNIARMQRDFRHLSVLDIFFSIDDAFERSEEATCAIVRIDRTDGFESKNPCAAENQTRLP